MTVTSNRPPLATPIRYSGFRDTPGKVYRTSICLVGAQVVIFLVALTENCIEVPGLYIITGLREDCIIYDNAGNFFPIECKIASVNGLKFTKTWFVQLRSNRDLRHFSSVLTAAQLSPSLRFSSLCDTSCKCPVPSTISPDLPTLFNDGAPNCSVQRSSIVTTETCVTCILNDHTMLFLEINSHNLSTYRKESSIVNKERKIDRGKDSSFNSLCLYSALVVT